MCPFYKYDIYVFSIEQGAMGLLLVRRVDFIASPAAARKIPGIKMFIHHGK
jgi:hypothetical protein